MFDNNQIKTSTAFESIFKIDNYYHKLPMELHSSEDRKYAAVKCACDKFNYFQSFQVKIINVFTVLKSNRFIFIVLMNLILFKISHLILLFDFFEC